MVNGCSDEGHPAEMLAFNISPLHVELYMWVSSAKNLETIGRNTGFAHLQDSTASIGWLCSATHIGLSLLNSELSLILNSKCFNPPGTEDSSATMTSLRTRCRRITCCPSAGLTTPSHTATTTTSAWWCRTICCRAPIHPTDVWLSWCSRIIATFTLGQCDSPKRIPFIYLCLSQLCFMEM